MGACCSSPGATRGGAFSGKAQTLGAAPSSAVPGDGVKQGPRAKILEKLQAKSGGNTVGRNQEGLARPQDWD
jgi:hypothetical protein